MEAKDASIIRSDFWFLDGNIILIAGSVAFKVHRGQLERHSEVFNGMFGLPQPPDEELFDDCLSVELHDSPSDIYYFLSALYDGLYFKQPRANDFPAIAAVLRLSTKYFVEHLRQRCLERLLRDWPTTLEGWDQRELEATNDQGHYTPRDACPHPILVIDLALELGLSSILPAAFYDLSRYGPSKITAGTPAPAPLPAFPLTPAASQSAPPAPEIKILSTELLCLAFKGRERAQQFMAKFVLENVQHRPACAACLFRHDEQDPSRPCLESFYFIALNLLRSIGGIACGRDADPLFTLVQAAEMLSRMDFSDGRKDCGLRMCHPCKLDFAQECGRAKREVWDLLPAWFELEERGEGGDESFCA